MWAGLLFALKTIIHHRTDTKITISSQESSGEPDKESLCWLEH